MDSRARQRGIALLILLAIVGMAVIFALVGGMYRSAGEVARARDRNTYAALAQAKAALIAYAVTYKDTHDNPSPPNPFPGSYYVPGYLPCPDLGLPLFGQYYEGAAAGNCGGALISVIGRLPWKTLGLDALKDSSGECLWYAVSGTYKNNPNGVSGSMTNSNMMNWDTNGQFAVVDGGGNTLAGPSPDNQAVAVIFAPGSALTGQDRTPAAADTGNCGGNYNAAAYLESTNGIDNSIVSGTASASSTFIAATGSDSFNDKLVYITRADIWNAIKKRSDFNNYLRAMTRRAAECVARYGTRNNDPNDERLPWASNVSLSASSVTAYAVNASYDDVATAMTGRLAFNVDTSRNNSSGTSNDISTWIPDYGTYGAYLFTSGSLSPNGSYCNYTADQKVWYDNWKDQLFYAVAGAYNPFVAWTGSSSLCANCLTIDNDGHHYAAVVIFAGEKLSGQSRNTAADKGSIANYLDGRNASNFPNSVGISDYQSAVASSNFDDIVYAIDNNLNIYCTVAATGAMVRPTTSSTVAPPGSATALKNYAACP